MSTQFVSFRHRGARLATALAVLFALPCVTVAQKGDKQPAAFAVMTDRASLAASNQFSAPNQFRVAGTGDVYFTSGGNSGLFHWSPATGPKRLLQTNDPIEELGIPDLPKEFAGSLLDTTGALLQVNAAGHAAFLVSAAIKGERDPAAVFVYDGFSYRLVDAGLESFTQILLNDNDKVAVLGSDGPFNIGPQVILVETGSGVVLVAQQGQTAPPSVGGTYGGFPQLIGFNNAGQLAFVANIQGSITNISRAIFLFDGTDVHLVAKSGGAGPGFNLPTGNPTYGVYYALNDSGKVAFWSNSSTVFANPAIWIGDTLGVSTKLVGLTTDPTGISGWGNYSAPLWLRGFNDSGKVLYDCNTTGGPGHALFGSSPKSVMARNVLSPE